MTTTVTTLPNGMRVVSDIMPDVETASLGVWVEAGARHEAPEQDGLSHLLEHMAFKGTERRSAQAIAEEIEAVGGHLNAYTSREHTAYVARVLKEDVPLAVDLVADILQHATFDEEELARERAVVVQEIAQLNDTPDDLVFDFFQAAAYPDQPMGRSILGRPEGVAGMSREQLKAYMSRHYSADRMVLVAAGRVDHESLFALAERHFDSLPRHCEVNTAPAVYGGGDVREARELEQVHLVIGFDGVAYDHPDYYPCHVLATALGGGMSSRLFQEVREKRGLAYSVYSFTSTYVDGGLFGVYAGCGAAQARELVGVISDEIVKVADGVDEQELERARNQLKAGLLMSLESSSARCEQIGRQMLVFGRPIPPAEIIEKVEAVDSAALRRVALRLVEGKPTVAAIGPIGGVEPYEQLAARFHA